MSCPTCNHTMQNLGVQGQRIFWCSRCGTLREYTGDFSRVELPAWLRQITSVANLRPPSHNQSQHTTVTALFKVDQYDQEQPRLELHMYGPDGRRVL